MITKFGQRRTLEAKVTGPLMSLTASGGFASALVFGSWKGRPTVHQLVTPSNPRSTDQTDERNIMRVTGRAQRWANVSVMIGPGRTETDKALLITAAPSGYAWNGNFAKFLIGAGNINFDADKALYDGAFAANHAAWEAAAVGLTPPMQAAPQNDPFTNAVAAVVPAGEVWFHYQRALFNMGIAAAPGAVPPVYA